MQEHTKHEFRIFRWFRSRWDDVKDSSVKFSNIDFLCGTQCYMESQIDSIRKALKT